MRREGGGERRREKELKALRGKKDRSGAADRRMDRGVRN